MSNVSIKMCPPCLRTPVHHVSGTYRERARVRGFSQALVNVAAIAALFDQAFDFGAAEDIVEGLVYA